MAIRTFHNDELRTYFHHDINLEDDSILLRDREDNTILTYSGNGIVSDAQGNIIGNIKLRNNHWIFIRSNGETIESNYTLDMADGLIDFEVEISKQYIQSNIFLKTKIS